MLIFLNGQFVPEERAVVSVFDRSFLYGDGLFETMRVFNGKPFRWDQHLQRLRRGAEFLKIALTFSPEMLLGFAQELIAKNKMPDALLRLTLSRGVGIRGYSPKGAESPTLVMTLHGIPAVGHPLPSDRRGTGAEGSPPRWKLIISSHRLPANEPLAQFKTCNKLPQILARAEADAAGADEALLLNTDGFLVEGASSNLFWIEGETVCTPSLSSGILPGVTRAVVLEICKMIRSRVRDTNIDAKALKAADGIFLSLSSFGIVEVVSIDDGVSRQSLLTKKISEAYVKLVERETM